MENFADPRPYFVCFTSLKYILPHPIFFWYLLKNYVFVSVMVMPGRLQIEMGCVPLQVTPVETGI